MTEAVESDFEGNLPKPAPMPPHLQEVMDNFNLTEVVEFRRLGDIAAAMQTRPIKELSVKIVRTLKFSDVTPKGQGCVNVNVTKQIDDLRLDEILEVHASRTEGGILTYSFRARTSEEEIISVVVTGTTATYTIEQPAPSS